MKIRQILAKYIPTIGWRRLSHKEVLALNLDRFRKYEAFFVTWESGKSFRLFTRTYSPKPPTNPPLAPA